VKSAHVHGMPVSDDSSKVCVLYDPEDGRVVHVHGVTTIQGGKAVSDAEVEQRTIAHAKSLGRPVQGLRSLQVPISAIRQGGGLKVNAEGTSITASEPPAHPRKRLAKQREDDARYGRH
jgi:hypothetical protein